MLKKPNVKLVIYIAIPVILAAVLLCYVLFFYKERDKDRSRESVTIAVPYSERVENFQTNFYTRWLEEKTGLRISFLYLEEGYEKESLKAMLSAEDNNVDAVFFPADRELITLEDYRNYAGKGLLARPQDYLPEDCNISRVQENCPDTDLSVLYEEGMIYCFPYIYDARTEKNMQILWINIDWLKHLGLALPRTAEEFRQVLKDFRDKDPNGNGIADEIPLVSCAGDYSLSGYPYLINAFTFYDGLTLPGSTEGGNGREMIKEEALRAGIRYCASLYEEGLLSGDCLHYTGRQLMELVNDPANTVGAFTSRSIADVIYTNNPDVLAHYVQLAPLSSDYAGKGYAVKRESVPRIGGIIPANAKHKQEAAQIMDLMLSKEASLIALYGEEGVDWRFSKDGELSSYGTRAEVTTIRYLKGEIQNKNFAGTGPALMAAEYTDGVTWNGDHSMTEYIDARAVKTYEPFYGNEVSGQADQADFDGAGRNQGRQKRQEYLMQEILRFITGERDIGNDSDWSRFLSGYERAGKE